MTRLKAQNQELRLRPPIEEFAASYFGYRAPQDADAGIDLPEQPTESELPEFEP
jgi:hypothetical protein